MNEAQQAPDVVLGKFLINSKPASVLFDSGASHSFVTAQYIEKHSISVAKLKYPMLVSSPAGDLRAVDICPKVNLTLRGVDFPANLIVLDTKGIDVILGMDWLAKFQGMIDCARRAVTDQPRRQSVGICGQYSSSRRMCPQPSQSYFHG